MKQLPLTVRRWRWAECDRLVDLGVFHEDPVELIGGHLVDAGRPDRARAARGWAR